MSAPEESKGIESPKTTDRSEKSEQSSIRLQGSVSMDEFSTFNEKNKEELSPENRRDRRTAGRGTFGECEIQTIKNCGKDKQTSVELKNGLPEKIFTHGQEWERSSNSKVWNVTEGDKSYELKADVRLKGNDLTAKVQYENGREVTYKNGEPTTIQHPNGEIWTKDTKHEGQWNVSVPNKDDPAHPHKTTIRDVQVNTADGDIKWHVDQGAAKGHDREITADTQYHDRLNGVEVTKVKLEHPVSDEFPNHQFEKAPGKLELEFAQKDRFSEAAKANHQEKSLESKHEHKSAPKSEHVEQVLYKAEKPVVPHVEPKLPQHEKSTAQKLEHKSAPKSEHVEQVLYKAEKPVVPHVEPKLPQHEKSTAQKLEHKSAPKSENVEQVLYKAEKPVVPHVEPKLPQHEKFTAQKLEHKSAPSEDEHSKSSKEHKGEKNSEKKGEPKHEEKLETDPRRIGFMPDLYKYYEERATHETAERARMMSDISMAMTNPNYKAPEREHTKFETKNDRFDPPGIGVDLHKFYAERARIETEERNRSFNEVNSGIQHFFEKQGEQRRREAFAELLTKGSTVKDHVMEQAKAVAPKVISNAMNIPAFDKNAPHDSKTSVGKSPLIDRLSDNSTTSSEHATSHPQRGALLNRLSAAHAESTDSAAHTHMRGMLLNRLHENNAASKTDEHHNAGEVKNTNSMWETGKNMLKTNWHTQSHINNGSESHVRSSYNGQELRSIPQSYISHGGDNSHPSAYQARPREMPHYNANNDANTNSMLRAASNMFVVNKNFVNYASSRSDGGGFKTYNGQALHRVPTSYISRRIH